MVLFENWNKSFANAVNNKWTDKREEIQSSVLTYSSSEEAKKRFRKAYAGRVVILGSTYSLQTKIEIEGYYNIKATPLGGSVCLLEELEDGVLDFLTGESEVWWEELFRGGEEVGGRYC